MLKRWPLWALQLLLYFVYLVVLPAAFPLTIWICQRLMER